MLPIPYYTDLSSCELEMQTGPKRRKCGERLYTQLHTFLIDHLLKCWRRHMKCRKKRNRIWKIYNFSDVILMRRDLDFLRN